jgi:hypothetical protein
MVRPAKAIAIAMAGVACVIGGIIAFGLIAAEPQPLHNSPLAILVLDGGARVKVAVGRCPQFEITEVRLVASPVRNGVVSSQETILWRYRPANPHSWEFDTAAVGRAVLQPFVRLNQVDAGEALGAYVFYERATAPRGFTNRTDLAVIFRLNQNASERTAYVRIQKQAC